MEGFARTRAPRKDIDAVRHHEGRIKSDPELADQFEFFARISVFAGVPAFRNEPVEKGPRSGTRDRAEMIGEILTRHADPIVLDGDTLGILVERNPDREGVRRKRWIFECLIAQS